MYDLWVSIASLILSVIAIYCSNKLQKQSNKLQERIVRIEEEREHERKIKSRQANVSAELQKCGKGYKFYLINSGESEAKNIQIKLNKEPLEDIIAKHMIIMNGPLPSNIGPNSKISFDVYYFGLG